MQHNHIVKFRKRLWFDLKFWIEWINSLYLELTITVVQKQIHFERHVMPPDDNGETLINVSAMYLIGFPMIPTNIEYHIF